MKTIKIKIPKDKILKMNKAESRQDQIEVGIQHLRCTICQSKKTYTRKTKHKVPKF